ncbi:MAG: hypothetical protein R3E97_11980 [Candidatus Eisenbacteria bacterium]
MRRLLVSLDWIRRPATLHRVRRRFLATLNRALHRPVRLAASLSLLCAATLFAGCRNELQTVVECSDTTVVVRYENGRLAEVLNDMDYDLEPGQQVKVTENCNGALHVVVAYAAN